MPMIASRVAATSSAGNVPGSPECRRRGDAARGRERGIEGCAGEVGEPRCDRVDDVDRVGCG